jgi:hypothetical protein
MSTRFVICDKRKPFLKTDRAQRRACPAAIRRLGDDGSNARTIGRMDAIQNPKTMAGSPDADVATIVAASVRQSCAWFLRSGVRTFVNR